jgi:ferrochelatase
LRPSMAWPLDTRIKGDPYYAQCLRTTDLLRLRLGLPCDRLIMTFQSRFGRAEWLKPYTDETIKALASVGSLRGECLCQNQSVLG